MHLHAIWSVGISAALALAFGARLAVNITWAPLPTTSQFARSSSGISTAASFSFAAR